MAWKQFEGQTQAVNLLQQAIRNDRVGHAYLFAGPNGVGKKAVAFHMAKALFCQEQDGDSCGRCVLCRRIENGNHSDVHFLAPDGALIKIGQIRDLQKEFAYRAKESKQKIYIIEQVDTMTPEAANSLLKFLEEPVSRIVAILLTDKPHAVLPTILSRCQQIRFVSPPPERIAQQLTQEGINASAARIASQLSVSMDQARELCQSKAFALAQNVVIQLTQDLVKSSNTPWLTMNDWIREEELRQQIPLLLDMLLIWLKDVSNAQYDRNDRLHFIEQSDQIEAQARRWSRDSLIRGMEQVMKTKARLQRHVNPQLALERLLFELQEGCVHV